MRSISAPACAIWPTLTVREVMVPLSGAVTVRIARAQFSHAQIGTGGIDARLRGDLVGLQLVEIRSRQRAGVWTPMRRAAGQPMH